MKVTAIEESQDISNMRVDELVGSLQTFEMGLNDGSEKKTKSIAFISNTEEENSQDVDEDLTNEVAMLERQLNRLLKKMDVRSKANVKNISSDISNGRRVRSEEKPKEGKEVKCYECDGYGHIRTECGTYLKKQKMSLAATWSDESDTEEAANLVTALTGRWGSDEDSSDGEVTFEELASTYRELCHKSVELSKQVLNQKKEITQLENEKVEYLETISKLKTEVVALKVKLDESQQVESQKIVQLENEKAEQVETIVKLKTEVMLLNSKLEETTKYVRMLNNGSDSLDKILQSGLITGAKSGIGYHKSKAESSYTGCKPQAKPKYSNSKSSPKMSYHMSHHQKRKQQKGKHQR
jgi:hypothetical protein